MTRLALKALLFSIAVLIFAAQARAQTATYHLHHEFTTRVGVAYQLKTAGPDAAAIAHSTQNLKNFAPGEYNISWWETQPGVPNVAGIIPSGSTVTFTLWMKQTFNNGTMYPRAKLYLENSTSSTLVCTATGSTPLTTTLVQYTLSCTTSSPISMATADWYEIWVGVNLTVGPGNKNVQAEVDIEGTLNGNYDSRIVVPLPVPPSISGVSPNSGAAGTSVTVSGSNFGASQGSSTIKFNGTTATPTSWTATSIVAPVPSGATTGLIVVTVGGATSNGVTFTVLTTGTISGTVTKLPDGTPLSGALVEALQSSAVIASTTSAPNGSYSIGSLAPGTYDVRVSATGYATHLSTGISVVAGGTNTLNVALVPQPAITNLSPASGLVGTAVTVIGLNFGATQGTSTITFSGVIAAPTSWSASSIVAPVPAGATTGAVVVNVAGAASNGVTFTVLFTVGIAGTVSHAGDSAPISGALIEAIQSGVVKASTNSAANGSYSISSVVQGAYDVRVSKIGYLTKLTIGIAVSPNTTTTVDSALTRPGIISGKVTQLDGTTPIVGAAVEVSQGTTTAGTATTNATGDYSVAGLSPGTYTLQASAIGYKTQNRPGVAVSEDATTTSNFSLEGAPVSSGITYIYDKLGRLIAAVDSAGDTARYSYDEVGNLLSISRQPSSQVSIIEFTPGSGLVGTSVTIYGTGFSSTASQNAVTFNGVAATVTSATATQIETTVPTGATTGPVAVTSPGGSATSATPFIVNGSSGAPTVTGFTPTSGIIGTSVTMTGTNFDTTAVNNKVKFNITNAAIVSVSATSIVTNVPSGATSGHISVATPYGKGVSTGDFFIPPSPFTPIDMEVASRMVFGETRMITIGTANKIVLILFDGIEGQRVSLNLTGVSIPYVYIYLNSPDGTTLVSTIVDNSSIGFIDTQTLPMTGTYTILIDPRDLNIGNITLSLYNVVDLTGPITTDGSPVTKNITVPGQNATLTFSGTAGQKISMNITGVTIFDSYSYIKKPDETTLAWTRVENSNAGFIDTQTLPVTGTYTIFIDPQKARIGNITLALYDVVDLTGPITTDGSPVTKNITVPGQNATLTFSGTAGQKISLNITGVTIFDSYSYIKKPDATTLASTRVENSNAGFIDTQTLPVTGTYTIFIDPQKARIGNITLSLYDVVDLTGPITTDGSPATKNTTVPGQNATLTFSGTAGQKISLNITGVTIFDSYIYIKKPDATTLASTRVENSNAGFIDTQTLPVTGTYTIFIDPQKAYIGNMTLTLSNVVDGTGSITIGGLAVTVNITAPGQNAQLTFDGTSGQQVTVHVTSNTMSTVTISLLRADGSVLTSTNTNGPSFNLATQTLSANETYAIKIDPTGARTGSMSVSVTSP